MPEQQSLRDAGGFGELAGRRSRKALAGEQRHRRPDDRLATLVAVEPGHRHGRQSKRLLTTGQAQALARDLAGTGERNGRPPCRPPITLRCAGRQLPLSLRTRTMATLRNLSPGAMGELTTP